MSYYQKELYDIVAAVEVIPDGESEDYKPAYAKLEQAVATYNERIGTDAGADISRKAEIYAIWKRSSFHAWKEAAERHPLHANYEGFDAAIRELKAAHARLCDAHLAAIGK